MVPLAAGSGRFSQPLFCWFVRCLDLLSHFMGLEWKVVGYPLEFFAVCLEALLRHKWLVLSFHVGSSAGGEVVHRRRQSEVLLNLPHESSGYPPPCRPGGISDSGCPRTCAQDRTNVSTRGRWRIELRRHYDDHGRLSWDSGAAAGRGARIFRRRGEHGTPRDGICAVGSFRGKSCRVCDASVAGA